MCDKTCNWIFVDVMTKSFPCSHAVRCESTLAVTMVTTHQHNGEIGSINGDGDRVIQLMVMSALKVV
jgi:hypothetical protein